MLSVSQLFIYPVKSLGGISVSSATVTETGFKYDRRWMLVDETNLFLSQREVPAMALLQVEIADSGITISHKLQNNYFFTIPFHTISDSKVIVQIFDEFCQAVLVCKEADDWFSRMLSVKCRLVYMPDSTKRMVDNNYATNNEITSFSDGYPFLIIGQSSLDDLNKRILTPLPINRFRPNIVFAGGIPFEEDSMAHFIINNIHFFGVKPCGRCVITTINQDNAEISKEPLKTLATYRKKNNKIYFGQNLLAKGKGEIFVGDAIEVIDLNKK